MKFIVDENVSPLVEREIISLGHSSIRLPRGTKDSDILLSAQKEMAAIISHDKDFLTLSPSSTEGIILIRIHPPWAKDVTDSLRTFLGKIPSSDWRGKLVLLERFGYHIRF